jgi:hypothetical protein
VALAAYGFLLAVFPDMAGPRKERDGFCRGALQGGSSSFPNLRG